MFDEAVFLWCESSGIDHYLGHPGGVLFCTGLRKRCTGIEETTNDSSGRKQHIWG